ncbi:MAG TPA: leucyl aminopeptidase [Anaerolineales bacterium]|nr:leucyl aminopeptidase [Anaerolineales bacterium]
MKIAALQGNIAERQTDAIILNLFEGVAEPGGATGAVDKALGGAIRDLIGGGDFNGKLNSTAALYPRGALPAQRIILVGLGKAEKLTLDKVRQASATATQRARALGAERVATIVHGAGVGGLTPEQAAQATAEGAVLGEYEFQELKPREAEKPLDRLTLVEFDPAKLPAVERGAQAGRIIAESVNFTRDLVNQPPNVCTPEYLAATAEHIAGAHDSLTCKVLKTVEMRDLGMGALLAVASASANPPAFIILEYRPTGVGDAPPVVLVGKAITFDSGGLSIKPAESMPGMKSDMAGGAAVLGAMRAVAALRLPAPVIGLVPATENVIGSGGYRPADVLRASNGKTIEIISTDAEGRLILADALVYANRYKPAAVVDLATLTGACVIALGAHMAAGLFAADESLCQRVQRAGERTGERVWRLPLYEEYREALKSDVAEMKNSAGNRYSGVGVSAAFLKEFAEGYPWAHLDIAGMAYLDSPKSPWPRGATGYGVRLLVDMLREWPQASSV